MLMGCCRRSLNPSTKACVTRSLGDETPMNFLQQLTGSFAQPAAENPTVEMIEAAYRHHGLPWRYLNCEVAPADLGAAVRGARAMGFAGFNCSLPHKVAVIEHLDGLGESARIMQAVNCVVRRDGAYLGENTDGKGFLASLRTQTDPAGQRMLLFGAGGAARAIAVEAALTGVSHIAIVNRTPTRGRDLVKLLQDATPVTASYHPWEGDYQIPDDFDLVVNATSVGLFPQVHERLAIDLNSLRPQVLVADVIPNPLRTHLIQAAEHRGCTVIDGLGMLVNQGVISIKYWTGVDVNAQVMRDRVIEVLGM